MLAIFLERALAVEIWAGALAKLAQKNMEEISWGRWVEVLQLQG